ncbi:MAG: GNAT family N-acetyltransferase [Candidatus Undinarchaeales archaeon]|nr:GNAT family N-acetyltransferase [Candidatus Undinarchaeales archaeon]
MIMKAILHTRYGPADELELTEVPRPVPGDNEVSIKVHATAVTTGDCNVRNLTFAPRDFKIPVRLFLGIRTPRIKILGNEVAGVIEAVGKDVTRFAVGDKVFGTPGAAMGAHAEYLCMPEDGVLAIRPDPMSWEEAEVVIAEHDGAPVGFALFFHNYSTFLGRHGIYIEDLYVRPEHRGKGCGKQLLAHLADLAVERGCGRLEWWVLDVNRPAIDFYGSLGAQAMDEWTVYRLTGKELGRLAAGGR